jgi:hypothetical protein
MIAQTSRAAEGAPMPAKQPTVRPPAEDPSSGGRRRVWVAVPLAVAVAGTALAVVAMLDRPVPTAHMADPPGVAASDSASAVGSPSASASASASASPSPSASARPGTAAKPRQPATLSGWPTSRNTGTPAGVALHSCATTISSGGTYDACQFNGDVLVKASGVKITRSLIKGSVDAGSGRSGEQSGLVISDTTIDCGCLADETHTPAAISESNYTLLRVNIFNSGHGAAVNSNVTIQDTYIHGLGANTDAHKDGIFSGNGRNVVIRHNNIECNDGSKAGCTSAIGLLVDFGPISNYTIDGNLLNTNGSYCFYGSGGPQKQYTTDHITFTNNHFGRAVSAKCGFYGPVTYFDTGAAGMVWSGNVWDDSGAAVGPAY